MTPYDKMIERADAARILGVPIAAKPSEIRQAWKRRVLESHPDRGHTTSDAFVDVNNAYRRLLDTGDEKNPDAFQPGSKVSGRPMRPSVGVRIDRFTPAEQRMCHELLAGIGVAGQVPTFIRRCGREVAYVFDETASAGMNHVAVMAGEMVDKRKVKPVHVEFVAASAGKETIEIAAETRRALFPGTSSVLLHFGCDGN